MEGAGEGVGLNVGIWAKGDGVRSRLRLGRGGRGLAGGVMTWSAVTCELACSCLLLISKDRDSVLLTTIAPAPSRVLLNE